MSDLCTARIQTEAANLLSVGSPLVVLVDPKTATMIQMAWLWVKYQPKSAIAQWFVQWTEGHSGQNAS
jgi:hypothetical protein